MAVNRFYSATAAQTTLSGSLTSAATTMTVVATTGFPASTPYVLILDMGTAKEEAVDVTAVAGTTLTITRGVDSTAAQAHDLGATVTHGFTARDFREPQQHMSDTINVHGLAGGAAVVGTTTTQTLSGKTLSSPTLSGTMTATGATIASPTITTPTIAATGWTNANHTHAGATTGGQITDTDLTGGAWTAYTPSWTATTNPAIGNGTLSGAYRQIGKSVLFKTEIVTGSTTTYGTGQWKLSLPVPANNATTLANFLFTCNHVGTGLGFYFGATQYAGSSDVLLHLYGGAASGALAQVTATTPFTHVSGNTYVLCGVYEAA